jgi:hypothetical protein
MVAMFLAKQLWAERWWVEWSDLELCTQNYDE